VEEAEKAGFQNVVVMTTGSPRLGEAYPKETDPCWRNSAKLSKMVSKETLAKHKISFRIQEEGGQPRCDGDRRARAVPAQGDPQLPGTLRNVPLTGCGADQKVSSRKPAGLIHGCRSGTRSNGIQYYLEAGAIRIITPDKGVITR